MTQGRTQPETCQEGKSYLIIEKGLHGNSREIREVRFVGYCPSPGQVVVSWLGKKEVVMRKDIFDL